MDSGASGSTTRGFHARLSFIVALTCLALLPAVAGSWILDDGLLIAANARVHELRSANLKFLLTHDMWDLDSSLAQAGPHLVYFRPLVMLSYAVDWKLGGGSSVTFHVTNLLLHAAAVLLAGRAVLRWTGSISGALLAAAYFGLHPARAESAAWISGRPDVLATLGLLVCLEGVAALCRAERTKGAALFWLGLVVGFASKETSLLLPVLVAVELATVPGKSALGSSWRRAWPLLASVTVAACYFLARRFWLPIRPLPMKGLGLTTHVGFILETLGRAATYFVAPFELSLNAATITERGGKVMPEPHYLGLGLAVALLLLGALLWTWRRKRRAFWALVAFLVSLFPTLNIIWIGGDGLTSPRLFYLPSLPFTWFVVELGKDRFQSVSPRLARLATYGVAVGLALLLGLRAADYRSPERFWAAELKSRPDVLSNVSTYVRQDWAKGDMDRALARSLCQYQISLQRFSYMGEGGGIMLNALERWAGVLPDAQRPELSALADFLSVARQPAGPAALNMTVVIDVPPGSKVRQELVRRAVRAQTQEAELRVRLGEPARALGLVRAARAACPRCEDLRDRQARVAYRAFDADYAEQLAQGSLDERWGNLTKRAAIARLRALNAVVVRATGEQRLQRQVQRLAELKLYGEALRLLETARHSDAGAASDEDLAHVTLRFAALAGDRPLTEQLAEQLKVPAPPAPQTPSADQIKRLLAQLHDGCAFPEELE